MNSDDKNFPQITIIIPVYNVSEYIEKCVDSVLLSNISDCEILLIDDGSTDGKSGALCDVLAQRNPKNIRVIHQENKGLGGARNTGIKESRGEYLVFLDSDDTLASGAIDVLKTSIEKSTADIIAFNMKTDDGNGNGEITKANYFESDKSFALQSEPEYLLSLPSACCRVWKKSLFIENDIWFPERVWYEDIRTTSKLFAVAKSIYTIEDVLYIYFQREGSIMRSDNVGRNHEIIDAFDDILNWFKKEGVFEMYSEVLCGLCMEHLYMAASVRVLEVDVKHPLLQQFAKYMDKEFPEYRKNRYFDRFSKLRKLVFYLLEMKQYELLRLLFNLKNRERR